MPVELVHYQVTRTPSGEWQFGYTQQGASAVGTVGSYILPDEIVRRIWEQCVGHPPLTGLEATDIQREWDRLAPVLAIEIERRMRQG